MFRPCQVPSALTVPVATSAATVTTTPNPARWMDDLISASLRREPVVLGGRIPDLLMLVRAVLLDPSHVLVADLLYVLSSLFPGPALGDHDRR